MTCEQCGTNIPEGARFCPNCGAPVAEAAAAERKFVTVLFADLARSTELANHLDPERFREMMQAFYEMVTRELASLRGRAEKFVGDAVMAVFGLPHAHDDDALRAIHAGLIIRDRTTRLGETFELSVPLGVRVGINSGAVAIGPGGGGQLLVGPAVNLSARLQQAAEPGEVLVGGTTQQLARDAVAFGPPRAVPAKGFAGDATAYPVEGLAPRSARRTLPLVGRARELALITDTFRRAEETSRAHLFTVLGEPGIGKTRLADEFLASLPDDVRVMTGRAGHLEEDTALHPIADMLRREIGVERDTPPDVVAKHLQEMVEGCCDPTESERAAARLGLVLGLGEESRESRPYRVAEVRAGFLALLQGRARSGPVVLVLEDLHLAKAGLLELIEQVVHHARGIPLFVLALAREELLETAPTWGGGMPDAVALRLEPLSEQEAIDLALTAGETIDRAGAERVARAAGGNPFFVVEATAMLLHERAEDGTLPRHELLPPTVQAVIESRIDHLPGEARDLIRKASVFARSTFQESDLELIAERDGEILQLLEREELLVRDRERTGVWRFRHDMLRDVAYASLAKRDRLRLHVTLADEIEKREGDRFLQAAAYHLEQAAHASLDLTPTDRSLAERAVEALTKAGDKARRGIESRAAIDLYERALALAGPEEEWGAREAWILSGLGEARYWLGEFEFAATALSRALELERDNAWTTAHAARFLADIELSVRGNRNRARELFDQALAAARELDDPWVIGRTLLMAGWEPYWREAREEARAMFEEALRVARSNPEGDLWSEARALAFIAAMGSGAAPESEILGLGEESLAIGRKLGDPFTVAVALERVGTSLRRMGRYDEAMANLDEAVRIFEDLDARWELASVLAERGLVRRVREEFDDAERDLRASLAIVRSLKDRALIWWIVGESVQLALERGQRDQARRLMVEVESELPVSEPGSTTMPMWIDALMDLADGERERALEHSREVLETERARGLPNHTAAQEWFVGRVFGEEEVGGADQFDAARATLEAAQWRHAIEEPERVYERIARPAFGR